MSVNAPDQISNPSASLAHGHSQPFLGKSLQRQSHIGEFAKKQSAQATSRRRQRRRRAWLQRSGFDARELEIGKGSINSSTKGPLPEAANTFDACATTRRQNCPSVRARTHAEIATLKIEKSDRLYYFKNSGVCSRVPVTSLLPLFINIKELELFPDPPVPAKRMLEFGVGFALVRIAREVSKQIGQPIFPNHGVVTCADYPAHKHNYPSRSYDHDIIARSYDHMITKGQDRSIKKSHSLEQDGSWPSSCLMRPKAVLDVQRLAFFHDGVPRRRFETAHTDLVDILTAAFDRGIRVEIRLPIPTAASYGLGDPEIIGSNDVYDHLRFRSHFGSSSSRRPPAAPPSNPKMDRNRRSSSSSLLLPQCCVVF